MQPGFDLSVTIYGAHPEASLMNKSVIVSVFLSPPGVQAAAHLTTCTNDTLNLEAI